jgi:hypothetical protein
MVDRSSVCVNHRAAFAAEITQVLQALDERSVKGLQWIYCCGIANRSGRLGPPMTTIYGQVTIGGQGIRAAESIQLAAAAYRLCMQVPLDRTGEHRPTSGLDGIE